MYIKVPINQKKIKPETTSSSPKICTNKVSRYLSGINENHSFNKNSVSVKFIKLNENVQTPSAATSGSAGFDLSANITENYTLFHNSILKIPTGIKLEIPAGYVGLIFARSGIASKNGVVPANCVGVIDSDYRGEVFVPLTNTSNLPFVIKPNMKIAQLIIMPLPTIKLQEVTSLKVSDREDGGFGSSGLY